MNQFIDEAHQLPPLIPLYPEIVPEGDQPYIIVKHEDIDRHNLQ